jgi:hypothetical protein
MIPQIGIERAFVNAFDSSGSISVELPADLRAMMHSTVSSMLDSMNVFSLTPSTPDERDAERARIDPLDVWRSRLARKCTTLLTLHKLKGFLRCGQGASELSRYSQEDENCRIAYAYADGFGIAGPKQEMCAVLLEMQQELSRLGELPVDAPPFPATSDTAPQCVVCQDAYGLFSVCDRCSEDKVLCEKCLDNCVLFNCIKTCITCRGPLRETARIINGD